MGSTNPAVNGIWPKPDSQQLRTRHHTVLGVSDARERPVQSNRSR